MPCKSELEWFPAFLPVIDPDLSISFFGQDVRWPVNDEHHPTVRFPSLLIGSKEVIGEKNPVIINAN